MLRCTDSNSFSLPHCIHPESRKHLSFSVAFEMQNQLTLKKVQSYQCGEGICRERKLRLPFEKYSLGLFLQGASSNQPFQNSQENCFYLCCHFFLHAQVRTALGILVREPGILLLVKGISEGKLQLEAGQLSIQEVLESSLLEIHY